MSKNTIIVIVIVSSLSLITICSCLVVERVPLDAMTKTRIIVTQVRILDYYSARGMLPQQLADLPPGRANRDTSTIDAWGRPIRYRVDATNRIILESLGRDGKPGGNGPDEDIYLTFDPSASEMLGAFSSSRPENQ